VIEHDGERVALCGLDLCAINEDVIASSRERVAQVARIASGNVFISTTHTHSGPWDVDPQCWPEGLEVKIAEAVALACERLTPAVLGAGWGMLHGHSFNRRRFEDEVDPAVLVIRADDLACRPAEIRRAGSVAQPPATAAARSLAMSRTPARISACNVSGSPSICAQATS
jgi:hypothetical protein